MAILIGQHFGNRPYQTGHTQLNQLLGDLPVLNFNGTLHMGKVDKISKDSALPGNIAFALLPHRPSGCGGNWGNMKELYNDAGERSVKKLAFCSLPKIRGGHRLSLAKKHRFLRILFLGSLLLTHAAQAISAKQVIIVDTVEHESSHQLVDQFLLKCEFCSQVQFLHMKGSLEEGKKIALKLKALENNKELDLVLAIGPPAAEMVTSALSHTPVIYTMVPEKMLNLRGQGRNTALPVDPPVHLQTQAISTVLPDVESIGLIVGKQRSWKKHPFDVQSLPKNLKLYEIDNAKQMPETLRKASNENKAILFIRDPMVLNRDSVKFIIEYTLKKQVYACSYSNLLVDLGMTMALVPNPAAFGIRSARLADQILSGYAAQPSPLTIEDFELQINETALQTIQDAEQKQHLLSRVK